MKYLRFIPAIIIIGFIWYLSDKPGLKSDYTPIIDFFLRKGAHIVEYFVLYLALFWGFLNTKFSKITNSEFNYINTKTFCIGFIATLLDEWHQTWVFGREGKPLDIAFDLIGFVLAYIVLWAFWNYTTSQFKLQNTTNK
jgi:VanZ family protein